MADEQAVAKKGWGFAVNGGKLTPDKKAVQGGMKPRGFWKSVETLKVLHDLTISAEVGAQILTVMPRDIDYYRRREGLITGKRASATLDAARAEVARLYAEAKE